MNVEAKLVSVVAMDPLWRQYRITATPQEALELVQLLPPIGKAARKTLADLVESINALVPRMDFGKCHPATGRLSHTFIIGREEGRLMGIELFKGYFPETFDGTELMQTIDDRAHQAGCECVRYESGDAVSTFELIWK